jgi:AcrR family transcriptional regulator
MDGVKPRRPYRSERRQEQARATRAAILAAAEGLFVEQGYTRTTIEAIAQAAGVATITVYSSFKTKREVVSALISAAVSGDQAPAPVYEQERAQAALAETDQRRQVTLFAAHMREILDRVSPLFEVLDQAASVEPDIADLRQQLLSGRLHGMRVFVRGLAAHGPLRAGLSESAAAETTWAVTAPQLFRMLTRDLGWNGDRWTAWATEMLAAALLPAPS